MTSKWRCGGGVDGPPCQSGPDRRGRCPYSKKDAPQRYLCEPVSKGGGWQCGLSDLDGGPCVDGPGPDGRCCQILPPCTPQLSERRQRRRWVLLLLIATIGVFGLFSTGAWLQWLISPGPTDHRHAMIEQCDVCHLDTEHEFSELVQKGIDGLTGAHESAMGVCLDCHAIGEHPQTPHTEAPVVLAGITQRLAANDTSITPKRVSELSCAACHQIHTEALEVDEVSDGQCQSCHVRQFESFQYGHPSFTGLPQTTARVMFDHRRHQEQHFDKQSVAEYAPQLCTDCHQVNAASDLQLAGFDSMCADCHLREDITNKLSDRIGPTTVFAVPNIDADTVDIGFWPNCRTTQFKRIDNMPVLMRRLLKTDPQAAAAIAVLIQDNTAMNSLDDVAPEVQQAVIDLAASVRRLADDLSADDAFERFSPESETRQIDDERTAQLIAAMPVDVRRLVASAWFAAPAADSGEAGMCPSRDAWRDMRAPIEKDRDLVRANPGWYLQAKSSYMALSYVPQVHADPVMLLFSELAGDDPEWLDGRDGFQCGMCHRVNAENDVIRIAWSQPADVRRTRFSHATHLTSGQLCSSCHRLDEPADEELFARLDHQFIDKAQCDDCHQAGAVEQTCTDCHSYHWQPIESGHTTASGWDGNLDAEANDSGQR